MTDYRLSYSQRNYRRGFWIVLIAGNLMMIAGCLLLGSTIHLGGAFSWVPSALRAHDVRYIPERLVVFGVSTVFGIALLRAYSVLSYKRIKLAGIVRRQTLKTDLITAVYCLAIISLSILTHRFEAATTVNAGFYLYSSAIVGLAVFGYTTARYLVTKIANSKSSVFDFEKFIDGKGYASVEYDPRVVVSGMGQVRDDLA